MGCGFTGDGSAASLLLGYEVGEQRQQIELAEAGRMAEYSRQQAGGDPGGSLCQHLADVRFREGTPRTAAGGGWRRCRCWRAATGSAPYRPADAASGCRARPTARQDSAVGRRYRSSCCGCRRRDARSPETIRPMTASSSISTGGAAISTGSHRPAMSPRRPSSCRPASRRLRACYGRSGNRSRPGNHQNGSPRPRDGACSPA